MHSPNSQFNILLQQFIGGAGVITGEGQVISLKDSLFIFHCHLELSLYKLQSFLFCIY